MGAEAPCASPEVGLVFPNRLRGLLRSETGLSVPLVPHAWAQGLHRTVRLLTFATTPSSGGRWMELAPCHSPEGVRHHGHPHPLWVLLPWTREMTAAGLGGSRGLGQGWTPLALCKAHSSQLLARPFRAKKTAEGPDGPSPWQHIMQTCPLPCKMQGQGPHGWAPTGTP